MVKLIYILIVAISIINASAFHIKDTIKDTAEALKRLPELPEIMDKANQALTYLSSGQIPQTSTSYSAFKEKQLEIKSFRNQSIIGIIFLVFFGIIVF